MEINNDTIYYWSPSIEWVLLNSNLKIEKFIYPEIYKSIFPQFYYITQNGISIKDIIVKINNMEEAKLRVFICDLIKKKILVTSLLSPHELFFSQKKLYESKFPKDIMYDPIQSENFKKMQLHRKLDKYSSNRYFQLEDNNYSIPDLIKKRRTIRKFNEKKLISFNDFSTALSTFKQIKNGENIVYNYPSDGGLYPIDIYLYIKANRIENMEEGLYSYSPSEHKLYLIDNDAQITDESQFFINKNIFNSAAFTVYFIYNSDVNMPKYHEMGYYYACIDVGIMVEAFNLVCETLNFGLCSIGDMQFSKIQKYFNLDKTQIYLHEVEVGIKL